MSRSELTGILEEDLRSHPIGGSDYSFPAVVVIAELCGNTEVTQHSLPRRRQKYVPCFDIPMNTLLAMHVLQAHNASHENEK